jgi:NADH:ubiquinone oxidoreductase subunit D
MGWHMTVEKLLSIEVPKRAQYIRVIMMELARIADHIVCNGILGVDTGAFTAFYMFMKSVKRFMKSTKKCVALVLLPIWDVWGAWNAI